MDDELLDLVNERDEIIGTIWRHEYGRLVQEKLGYIRAVELFIQNDAGKLWIPTRTADKRIAPNGLDFSMGGHVAAGETYLTAALRETREELNLDLSAGNLQFIKKFSPGAVAYFRCLYLYKSNVTPSYNPADFVGAAWLSPDEIITLLDAGIAAKISLRETLEALAKLAS